MALLTQQHKQTVRHYVSRTKLVKRAHDLTQRHGALMLVAPPHSGKMGLILQLLQSWEIAQEKLRAVFVKLTEHAADLELERLANLVAQGLAARTVVIIEVLLVYPSAHIQAELTDLIEEMMSQEAVVICTFVPRCFRQMPSLQAHPALSARDLLLSDEELAELSPTHVHQAPAAFKRMMGIATAAEDLIPNLLADQIKEVRKDLQNHDQWHALFQDMLVLKGGSATIYGHQLQGDLQRFFSYLATYYPALDIDDYHMTFYLPDVSDGCERAMLSKIYEHRPQEMRELLAFMMQNNQHTRACYVAKTVLNTRQTYEFICQHSLALTLSGALFDEQLHPERYARGETESAALYGPAYELPYVVTNIDDEGAVSTSRFSHHHFDKEDDLVGVTDDKTIRRSDESCDTRLHPSVDGVLVEDKRIETGQDRMKYPNKPKRTTQEREAGCHLSVGEKRLVTRQMQQLTGAVAQESATIASKEKSACSEKHLNLNQPVGKNGRIWRMDELTQKSKRQVQTMLDEDLISGFLDREWNILLGEAWAHVAYAWMLGQGYVLDTCVKRGLELINKMKIAQSDCGDDLDEHCVNDCAEGEGVSRREFAFNSTPHAAKLHLELIEALEMTAVIRLGLNQIAQLQYQPTSPGAQMLTTLMTAQTESQSVCATFCALSVTPAHHSLSAVARVILEHFTVVASIIQGEADMVAAQLALNHAKPQQLGAALTCANLALLSCMLGQNRQSVLPWFEGAVKFFEEHHLQWINTTYQLCMQMWYALSANRPSGSRLRERVQAYGMRLKLPLLEVLAALDELISLAQSGRVDRAAFCAHKLKRQTEQVPCTMIAQVVSVISAACFTHHKPSLESQDRYATCVQARAETRLLHEADGSSAQVIPFVAPCKSSLMSVVNAVEQTCLAYGAFGHDGLMHNLKLHQAALISEVGLGVMRLIAPLMHEECRGTIEEYMAHKTYSEALRNDMRPSVLLHHHLRWRDSHAWEARKTDKAHQSQKGEVLRLVEANAQLSASNLHELNASHQRDDLPTLYTPAYLEAIAQWSGARLSIPAPTQLIDNLSRLPKARVELSLLSGQQLRIDGQLVVGERGVKRRMLTLITALGIFANKDVLRDSLIEELWGHMAYKQANNNLYVSVSKLKKLLGQRLDQEPYIINSEHSIRLHIEQEACDVARFHNLDSQIARHLTCPEIPLDELLKPYIALSQIYHNCVCGISFEPHGIFGQEVARLETTFIDHMVNAGYLCLRVNRPTLGLWFARRAGSYAKIREDVCQLLMLTLALSGQRAEAINLYFAHLRYLNSELGVEVSGETRAVYQQILVGDLRDLHALCLGLTSPSSKVYQDHVLMQDSSDRLKVHCSNQPEQDVWRRRSLRTSDNSLDAAA